MSAHSVTFAPPPGAPATTPIRVLVADDSAFMRTAITRMIESDPGLKVVGTALDGVEALEKAAALNPDVMTLDIEMPRLDGLSVLRRLMAEDPRPVIMVSSLSKEGAEATLEAFDLGAFECIPKQLSYASMDILKIRDLLVAKVRAAAAATYLRKCRKSAPAAAPEPLPATAAAALPLVIPELVAIGCSTGGPKALQSILPQLPSNLRAGVVIVQHMPPGFTGPFANRLNSLSQVTVREASDHDWVEHGTVLLAPAGKQLTVFRKTLSKFAVRISDQPRDTPHIPSVDVMMLSAAEAAGEKTMGIILTGMGSDGAKGMKLIADKGGYTVGQDEASCSVYGMPRSCAEQGSLKRVLSLTHIPAEILSATRYSPKRSL